MDVDKLINTLIDLGRGADSIEVLRKRRDIIERDGINRKSPHFWIEHCHGLSNNEAIDLFRGLVLAENDLKLSGGSVSGTIWILRYLDGVNSPETIYELINWALNSNPFNPYCPLGGRRLLSCHLSDGKNLSKQGISYLQSLEMACVISENKRRALSEDKHIKEKRARDEVLEKMREDHFSKSAQLREEFKAEMSLLSGLTEIERLDRLVKSHMPVIAFPKELFDLERIRENYSGNPPIEKIRARLQSYKGHWAKLLMILEAKNHDT